MHTSLRNPPIHGVDMHPSGCISDDMQLNSCIFSEFVSFGHGRESSKHLPIPSRRRLLDRLNERSGQTLRELCAGLDMARQSVSKHLAVLEGANLVTTVWRGREKLHYVNAAPINEIAERWIDRYDRDRVHALGT